MLASPASPTVGTQVETDQETSFKLSKTLLNAVPENWRWDGGGGAVEHRSLADVDFQVIRVDRAAIRTGFTKAQEHVPAVE